MRLGMPQAMLPEVRNIADADGLESIEERLPEEAHDALFLYLAGDSYEDLVREREAPPTVDVEDFTTALQRPESQMRFAVAADEMELEAMLNAPLARWRVFLHPSQRRLVERDWNGPLRGRRHRQDGGRHAPRPLPGANAAGGPHPVHHLHAQSGRGHRAQPGAPSARRRKCSASR